ncbi:hypothetical protein M3Y94_01278800 [Aphelenchoides besseyi]|nr:hypothetical protein M3Y94_01278800 [Aphelenchoides besseyi]
MTGPVSNQTKFQARAILLEQFKKGVNDPQLALNAVWNELGPNSMSKTSATLWFNRFRKHDFSLGKGSGTKVEQKLMVDSKFLATKRALFCKVSIEDFLVGYLEITGSNGRFQFFLTSKRLTPTYWVLDTFHGRKKQLILNSSDIRYRTAGAPNFHSSEHLLTSIHFIDEEKCLLVSSGRKSYMVSATFDMTSCTMKLEEYRHLADSSCCSLFADSRSLGLLEKNRKTRTTHYMDVDLKDDLKFENRVDLRQNLWLKYATRRDEMLIGFREDGRQTDLQSLITISLSDGGVSTRATTVTEEVSRALCPHKVSYVWINGKLFTHTLSKDSMSCIYVFDLETLEWKNTRIQLVGQIEHMSSADNNVLIVNVSNVSEWKNKEVYRFSIFGPDSLLNLQWIAARRRAQFEPEFYDQIVQKLPTNCHLRCPWQDDS